jgi:hypothetical protein
MTAGGRCRMTGLAVGAGLGFALARTYLFDLAPVVLALAVVVGMLAGEAVTPRPLRRRGVATLRPRRIRDYLPKPALATILLLGAGIQGFVLLRLPDRPDHEVQYFGTAAPVSLISTKVTLGVVAVLAAVTVWLLVRSAQAGTDESDHAADEAWRRAVVHRIVHCCAALFALVFTMLGFWYADREMDWRAAGSPAYGIALSLLSGVGLAIFARYAGALAFDRPSRSRSAVPPEPEIAAEVVAR